jgi:hyperosmotically inducible protein
MKNRTGTLVLNTTLAGLMTFMIIGCNQPTQPTGPLPPGTTVGTEIDDTVITTAIKTALLANPEVRSFDLQVETRKGEVQLSGFVDNQGQIDRATAVAQNVSGVKSVQNKMTLKGSPASVGNKVDDSIVTTRVKSALLNETSIKSLDIAVITRKGEVQLSGFVDNQQQIDRALVLTRGIEGVVAVNNEMSIKK